jgi:nitrate/nitrite transporter NarK
MSVLWVFLWGVLAIELMDSQAGLSHSRLVLLVIGPLIVGWGIWWIRRE